jgi:hypothetical protein
VLGARGSSASFGCFLAISHSAVTQQNGAGLRLTVCGDTRQAVATNADFTFGLIAGFEAPADT